MIRLVDLSFDIFDKAPTFYPDPKTAVIEHLEIENLNYNITQLVMSTHLGTHLDAPFHFFDDGRTVENLDVRKGFGPAWVLDFTHKKGGEAIGVEDMKQLRRQGRQGQPPDLPHRLGQGIPPEALFRRAALPECRG